MDTSKYCRRVIVALGGTIPIGTRFKGLVQSSKQPNNIPLETNHFKSNKKKKKKKDVDENRYQSDTRHVKKCLLKKMPQNCSH
jgi:spore coat polysaccharide biosynthesis predicted glycosyltransferase SpsG